MAWLRLVSDRGTMAQASCEGASSLFLGVSAGPAEVARTVRERGLPAAPGPAPVLFVRSREPFERLVVILVLVLRR